MALVSGDTVVFKSPLEGHVPTSQYASLDFTAAPDPVFDFDDGVDESVYFKCIMPGQYDGSAALKVILGWKFTTFGAGGLTCDWEVAFYRVQDDVDSIEAYTFATALTVLANDPSAANELNYAEIAFTNAQADGIQPNELFILKVMRDSSGGTASPGDAELAFVEIQIQ